MKRIDQILIVAVTAAVVARVFIGCVPDLRGTARYTAEGLACVAEAGTRAEADECIARVRAAEFGDAGEP